LSEPRQIAQRPYELVDLVTGDVLATGRWWHEVVRGPARELIEREGRERASTLVVRGGDYYYVDDGTSVHDMDNDTTGDELARAALLEPYVLDVEPPIGLDPHAFNIDEYQALPEIKPELWGGCLFDDGQGRATVARALLANMGLRAIVKLAPRELWLQALNESE
jgi:hypothetical protein